jgi:hypothetical protein
VLVARDFPPFEKTHCRIAFGTMDEMKKAVAVFGEVLGKKAAGGPAVRRGGSGGGNSPLAHRRSPWRSEPGKRLAPRSGAVRVLRPLKRIASSRRVQDG